MDRPYAVGFCALSIAVHFVYKILKFLKIRFTKPKDFWAKTFYHQNMTLYIQSKWIWVQKSYNLAFLLFHDVDLDFWYPYVPLAFLVPPSLQRKAMKANICRKHPWNFNILLIQSFSFQVQNRDILCVAYIINENDFYKKNLSSHKITNCNLFIDTTYFN